MSAAAPGPSRRLCAGPSRSGTALPVPRLRQRALRWVDNLVLMCRRHHRAVHEGGFRVTVDAAGGVQFLGRDGRPWTEAPPAPAWTGPALEPTNDNLAGAGIEIDADTATPSWGGEPLDLDYAMRVLWRPRHEPPTE